VSWFRPSQQQRTAQPVGPSSPAVGWEEELEEKIKTHALRYRRFNRAAKEENNNNSNTDKKNIQSEE